MTTARNWGPAVGCYDLAEAILPSSGASHNQLAAIAMADGNHFRTTYHLYRALAAADPHPTAQANLEMIFKKILAMNTKDNMTENQKQNPGDSFIALFMRLHAMCHKGFIFVDHDDVEADMLSELAVALKERAIERILHKFVLVNISAQSFAGSRLDGNVDRSLVLKQF